MLVLGSLHRQAHPQEAGFPQGEAGRGPRSSQQRTSHRLHDQMLEVTPHPVTVFHSLEMSGEQEISETGSRREVARGCGKREMEGWRLVSVWEDAGCWVRRLSRVKAAGNGNSLLRPLEPSHCSAQPSLPPGSRLGLPPRPTQSGSCHYSLHRTPVSSP